MKRLFAASVLVALMTAQACLAVTGRSISLVVDRSAAGNRGADLRGWPVVYTITDNIVTNTDTLTQWLCMAPSFNFTATKAAFFRLSIQRNPDKTITGSELPCYLSVIDLATKQITDLAQMPIAPINLNRTAWPKGNWVYYHKPKPGNPRGPSSGEIWRVDVTDPSEHSLVCDYTITDGEDGQASELRRFSMSADGNFAITHTAGGGISGIVAHRFPPDNIDPLLAYDNMYQDCAAGLGTGACNPSIAPGGDLVYFYTGAQHNFVNCDSVNWVSRAEHRKTIGTGSRGELTLNTDVEGWIGENVGNVGEFTRGAVNSDKWVLQNISWTVQGDGIYSNGNQVIANWVDRIALWPTHNATGNNIGAETGDFWIDGGVANDGKREDIHGAWVAVDPVGVHIRVYATGSNPYQVTMTPSPSDADIYYTTDGSEPTLTNGTKYGGVFTFNPTDLTKLVLMKIKGFKTGETPSRTIVKRFYPYLSTQPTGISVQVWKGMAGAVVTDLTSDARYPASPDQEWMSTGGLTLAYGGLGGELDNFGARYHGYLVPHVTGSYIFEIMARDQATLSLSTSAQLSGAVALCSSTSNTNFKQAAGQTSASVSLVAGTRYYICILHKCGASGSNDILNTRWTLPDGTTQWTIPNDVLLPYESGTNADQPLAGLHRTIAASPARTVLGLYALNGAMVWTPQSSRACKLPIGVYVLRVRTRHNGTAVSIVTIKSAGEAATFLRSAGR